MTNKEEIINEIDSLQKVCDDFHKQMRVIWNKNSDSFKAILPDFKYFTFDRLDDGTFDESYELRFNRGPSVTINGYGDITYFSTSGFSARGVDKEDLEEIMNYSEDTFKLFSFLKEKRELVAKTLSEFESVSSYYDLPSSRRLNELQNQLRDIINSEAKSAIQPEEGKILIYLEEGHHRRGCRARMIRTIVKVTKVTEKRFTFVRINYERTGFMTWDETKAIVFDKLCLPDEEELEIIKNFK